MRYVFDTCIIVAGFRSRYGASRMLLNLVLRGRIRLVATPALFLEYEMVLKRNAQISVHGYTATEIDDFLTVLATFTDKVDVHYRWRPQLRDPNDEMVLESAIAGGAPAIITHNIRDFLPASTHFGIHVLTPGFIIEKELDHE